MTGDETEPRPGHLTVVIGTGTEVGKTWVGAAVLAELRARGLRVAARKPAQSFEPGDATTDADVLAGATGEARADVCPAHRCYPVAYAPPMAAAELGRPAFTLGELIGELRWTPEIDVGLVESAGGVRSPLADDGDAVELIAALAPDSVVLVADAGLGTINAVRTTLTALAPDGPPTVVVLNRFDPDERLHQLNLAWLRDRDGLEVATGVAELADWLV
jgi:dethiobiotin synthetase